MLKKFLHGLDNEYELDMLFILVNTSAYDPCLRFTGWKLKCKKIEN